MLGTLLLLQCLVAGPENEQTDPRGKGIEDNDYAVFEISQLKCVIGNNKSLNEHLPGYNGVFAMVSSNDPQNAYVPSYSGINLEHFFDATPRNPDPKVFFEPRYAPMLFKKLSPTTAELHQPPTPVYQVESWTSFQLTEPYYIDISFRCIPRANTFAGGFMGIFWASYINAPEDKSIYFLGPGATLELPKWLQLCTQQHNHFSSVLGEKDIGPANFPELPPVLWNQISPLKYSIPFFYGRVRDMVIIYLFEPNPYLRFTHSPSGGGPSSDGTDTNPAWDFQLVIPHYEPQQEYLLKLRVVYKRWLGREDVLQEVKKYYRTLKTAE